MKISGKLIAAVAALGVMFVFAGCDASAELPIESTTPTESAAAEETATAEATETPTEDIAMPTETQDTAAEASQTAASTDAADVDQDSSLPAPDQQYMTLTLSGQITDLDREQDIVYITEQGADTTDPAASVGAVEVDDCIIIDAQTGLEVDDDTLQVGDNVTAYIGYAMSRSIPPQAPCSAIITNLPTDGTGVAYVRALTVTPESDALSVLNQNADMYVTIPDSVQIEAYDEAGQTIPSSYIQQGSRMIVWYDQLTRSIPPQAIATKVIADIDIND